MAIRKKQDNVLYSYTEKRLGGTLYRVTRVYQGRKDLSRTMRRLTVKHIADTKNT